MSEWNSIRGKSNGMINVAFVAIIKFIKVGRVWSPFDWYLLQRHPCPDPALCPWVLSLSTCLLEQIIQNSLQPSLNTTLSSPSVTSAPSLVIEFLRSINRNVFADRPPPLTLTGRPTLPLYYLSPSPKFANHRYNKGVLDQWLWAAASVISLALIDSGLRMTSDHTSCHSRQAPRPRHRRLRRADTERWRQSWGDLKQCWLRYYLLIPAACGRIKDVLNYIRVSEVSIMSTRWNSFKWIFYLARIFRQS